MQIRFPMVAVATAFVAATSGAYAGVAFDANIELDITKRSGDVAVSAESVATSGRIEINANAELVKNGDNYVTARGSLIVPVNGGSVTVDDAWVKLGNSAMDLKIGRFEAADLFPVAKDTVLEYVVPAGYHANALRGRITDGRLHAMGGFNASPALRVELGLVTQKKDDATLAYGVRPTLVYSAGDLTLRAGLESYKQNAISYTGFGLSAGYALNKDANVNVNFASVDGDSKDADKSSVGINLVYGPAGIGFVKDTTDAFAGIGKTDMNTVYAAYSFPLMGVKGATVTPAFSYSEADGKDMAALRVRFNYAF